MHLPMAWYGPCLLMVDIIIHHCACFAILEDVSILSLFHMAAFNSIDSHSIAHVYWHCIFHSALNLSKTL